MNDVGNNVDRVDVGELFARHVSIFNTVRSSMPPRVISVREFLNEVQDGRWRAEVGQIRATEGNEDRGRLKLRLPAIKPSGTFRGLRSDDLLEHSGIVCIDIDGIAKAALRGIKARLRRDSHTLAFFVSPGGSGLKVLVPVSATDAEEHRACYEAARTHLAGLLPSGVKLDPAPSNVASNCFASYDPAVWRATEARAVFVSPDGRHRGCDIDTSHVIESYEKEPFSSSSPEEGGFRGMPTSPIRLAGFPGRHVYPNWMAHRRHLAGDRNATIVERVPVLLSLVSDEVAAILLLRWFDDAPPHLFKASRLEHWRESWAAIRACLASYSQNPKVGLNRREIEAYASLRDDRQRATFRICRSLSLARSNEGRTFFLPASQLGDRLACACESAARQLSYLTKREILEVTASGAEWAPGKRPTATRYRWLLT